jgi:hypothetical protein
MGLIKMTQEKLDSIISAINNRAKSADVNTALATKQDALIAGTNITIAADGKTISANDASVAFTEITGKPTTLSGYGITDAAASSHVGATGTAHGAATTSVNGFMSSTDKTKLDGVAAGANAYALPVASTTVLGGVKAGTNITIDGNGVISASGGLGIGQTWQDVIGSRKSGVTYTNTTGNPIQVQIITLNLNSNASYTVGGITKKYCHGVSSSASAQSTSFIVPNLVTYSAQYNTSNTTANSWLELR